MWAFRAPGAWFAKLHHALVNFGFVCKSNQSLFVCVTSNAITYLLVYVDDILTNGNDKTTEFHKTFAFRDFGIVTFFFVIQGTQMPDGGFHLSPAEIHY